MKIKNLRLILLIATTVIIAVTAFFLVRDLGIKGGRASAEDLLHCKIPRVLIITTGKDGTGALPEGVILTMESFLSQGAYTRVASRDALLDRDYLSRFNILLMLTAINYHDADRQYSLTYMDDLELQILRQWIEDGGLLISGDNLGRNLRNGTDRISMYGRLEPGNWPLAEPLGVMLSERNMEGFALKGALADSLHGMLIPPLGKGSWILVPDSILSEQTTVMASWSNDTLSFPALLFNPYGNGGAILLPSSYLLHPSNDGGHWNAVQINAFCEIILNHFHRNSAVRFGVNPWPNGSPAAFAVSLNPDGAANQYQRIFELLKKKTVTPTLFVNRSLDETIVKILQRHNLNSQSNGFRKVNMRELSFSETVFQIEMNEQSWLKPFTGFRFPFTLNSVAGMEYLQRKGYLYDSSIGKDHTQSFRGSLFPYHLPVFSDGSYRVLDLLEISPLARDDYFYYRAIQDDGEAVNRDDLVVKAELFADYLLDFWKTNTLKKGGMMVYLGHPLFTGYNDTVVHPLSMITDTARADGAWITTMEEIANRWQLLDKTVFQITRINKDSKQCTILTLMPEGQKLERVTVTVNHKPRKVQAAIGKATIREAPGNQWFILFDATSQQKVEVHF